MNAGRLVFSQIADVIHREQFDRCVSNHPMPRASRSFTARDQFLCMAFAQLTYRESLRDIEACLESQANLLYAMGIRGSATRTNLAYANEHRSWKVYFELAQILIRKARRLYATDRYILEIDEIVYAIDSSTIDLCMNLFPWARFRRRKSAIKLHAMIDLSGSIPAFIAVTEGRVHDVNALDWILFEAGAFYVLDRGYVDFLRLARIHAAGAFFVTRAKANMSYYVRESRPVDKTTGLRSDQTIRLNGTKTKTLFPHNLRRVSFLDAESGKLLAFVTNNFEIEALVVAKIYKSRWQIELFFKWIKQNLRVKSFFGLTENAVKTQIWIAVCVYLMVAILNKTLRIEQSMSRILQVISVNIFSKDPIHQLLMKNDTREPDIDNSNQLIFNDL
ncbi:IS4 family transposase [Pelagicoccus enzymogenes]|uniref:IS4 family transposase n=1 Tax=Pelagicoccus enzymogenes TaxID=2773457 RepID=UPI00280E72DC|nr:IS4 family transposase [Pelagicoccus enzymogenes]MDQ8201323.1 IS4 family transposase [Pelagicoccus enzymogenes]